MLDRLVVLQYIMHTHACSYLTLCVIRQAWQQLGDISKEEAMTQFIDMVAKLCPLLQPYVDAHKREKEEQERKR